MKRSKYIGGSKIVSFRLPLQSLSTATIEIKAILAKYEIAIGENAEKSVKSTMKQSKTKLKSMDSIKPNDVTYNCGCARYNGLFRRHSDCKELLSKH